MKILNTLESRRVFHYFSDLAKIPHGSGNMQKISDYCVSFAKAHSLEYYVDDAKNVIIYKKATAGYENSKPLILQGHLDMVCQKTADSKIDFLKDGLELTCDGNFLRAKNTTLGADNGIGAAMMLAVLESDQIPHPEIQAVFTTDEEVGMLGASALDMAKLSAKQMINLDSEDEGIITVSCAGGADFKIKLPINREKASGKAVKITLSGLLGGHSGVDINKHRLNAAVLMGRVLNGLISSVKFNLIDITGGDKANAITNRCEAVILCDDNETIKGLLEKSLTVIKSEISSFEGGFNYEISDMPESELAVMDLSSTKKLIFCLFCAPNGVLSMSADIENLVETSLNLGVLKSRENFVDFSFALRSGKESTLQSLISKMQCFAENLNAQSETAGYYPPWEYRSHSPLHTLYLKAYKSLFNKNAKTEAIHAGLECAIFASRIDDIDCVSIGPALLDIHTVNERADIYSVDRTYKLLLEILKGLK